MDIVSLKLEYICLAIPGITSISVMAKIPCDVALISWIPNLSGAHLCPASLISIVRSTSSIVHCTSTSGTSLPNSSSKLGRINSTSSEAIRVPLSGSIILANSPGTIFIIFSISKTC